MYALLHDPMQLSSFAGAIVILIAYAGHQLGKMSPRSLTYNLLNALGSGILAYIAFFPFKLGFAVLEVTWAVISIWAIFRHPRESI
jgi:hypothetical protein